MSPDCSDGSAFLEDQLRLLSHELSSAFLAAFAGRERLGLRTKRIAHDLVTDADEAIEAQVRRFLAAAFPGDGFLGEESGGDGDPDDGRRWVVDPIDGTMNFAHGMPWACSSVGLTQAGAAVAGIVAAPFTGDLYLCAGRGSERNGARLQVAGGGDLRGEMVLLEVPSGVSPSVLGPLADAVISAGGSPRTMGSGALALALVAAGVAHGMVHAGPSIWDVAAGVALVEQAGGSVRAPGGPYVLGAPGPLIAGSEPTVERLAAALERCPAALGSP